MDTALGRTLFWAPRVLGLLFALFTSVFALDVFREPYRSLEFVVPLAMHLVPTALVVLVLVIAWRWERVGAVLLFGLAGFYAATVGRQHPMWILTIAGPVVLVGLLFLASGWYRAKMRRSPSST